MKNTDNQNNFPAKNEKISIIVPCYNVEKYIKKCINSIKNQSYSNFVAYIVDDGSTDSTAKIAKSCIKGDKRFKYFFKPNGGLSFARNFGLSKVKTKYVCFIDSDDYIEKDYLKLLFSSILERHSDISICYINQVYKNHTDVYQVDNSLFDLCKNTFAVNKLFKTELFSKNKIQFPVGKQYEDLGTIPKFIMLNPKISIVKVPLYNYVQRNTSIIHTNDQRIFEICDVIDGLEEFAYSHHLQEKYFSMLEFLNIYHILIGVIYRSGFLNNFNIVMIKGILNHVEDKYPLWHKNRLIKNLPPPTSYFYIYYKNGICSSFSV